MACLLNRICVLSKFEIAINIMLICLIVQTTVYSSIALAEDNHMHVAEINLGELLLEAVRKGKFDKIKVLIAKGANPNYSEFGVTPLIEASGWGHNDIVMYLIAEGADVNFKAKNNMTALMAASMLGHTEVMKTLISNGANLDVLEDTGWNALRLACRMRFNDTNEAIDLLLHSGVSLVASGREGTLNLYFLAYAGKTNHVKDLISRGAPINEKAIINGNNLGHPLYGAVENGKLESALVLIENGAVVNLTATNDWTPLMMAASNNDLPMVKLLLDKGADARLTNVDNKTALMLAQRKISPNIDVIKLLEEAEKLAK